VRQAAGGAEQARAQSGGQPNEQVSLLTSHATETRRLEALMTNAAAAAAATPSSAARALPSRAARKYRR